MNQINGYCQIELPDRIALNAIPNSGVSLTSAEVKPLIKALNLDQVKAEESGYSSYINAWLNKPVIVSAYMDTEETGRDVKSIFHASIVSIMMVSDTLRIHFIFPSSSGTKIAEIAFGISGGEPGEDAIWSILVTVSPIIQ